MVNGRVRARTHRMEEMVRASTHPTRPPFAPGARNPGQAVPSHPFKCARLNTVATPR